MAKKKKKDLRELREEIAQGKRSNGASGKGDKTGKTGKTPRHPKKQGKNALIYILAAFLVVLAVGAGLFLSLALFSPGPAKPAPAETPVPGTGEEFGEPLEPALQEAMEKGLADLNAKPVPIGENAAGAEDVIDSRESAETEKFSDLSNLLKVTFEITDRDEATIEEIKPLESGRITIAPPGDYSIQLLDARGSVLYELKFDAVFVLMSDPPTPVEKIKYGFVLPYKENAKTIAITKKKIILAEKEFK